jgi:gamma-glutamyltranspeptidase
MLVLFDRHGKVPWEDLFTSAIRVAENGFRVTDLLYSKLVVNTGMIDYTESDTHIYYRNQSYGLRHRLSSQEYMPLQVSLLNQVIKSVALL